MKNSNPKTWGYDVTKVLNLESDNIFLFLFVFLFFSSRMLLSEESDVHMCSICIVDVMKNFSKLTGRHLQ